MASAAIQRGSRQALGARREPRPRTRPWLGPPRPGHGRGVPGACPPAPGTGAALAQVLTHLPRRGGEQGLPPGLRRRLAARSDTHGHADPRPLPDDVA